MKCVSSELLRACSWCSFQKKVTLYFDRKSSCVIMIYLSQVFIYKQKCEMAIHLHSCNVDHRQMQQKASYGASTATLSRKKRECMSQKSTTGCHGKGLIRIPFIKFITIATYVHLQAYIVFLFGLTSPQQSSASSSS